MNIPVRNQEIDSIDESFHICFYYFVESLRELSLNSHIDSEVLDGINVAREVQNDFIADGTLLINWPGDHFTRVEIDAIAKVIYLIKELASDALLQDHVQAMTNAAWNSLRLAADWLIKQLESAIIKNRKFFDDQVLKRPPDEK